MLAEEADIVFMPYNYVTEDVSTMQKLLAGAVLILDEAHNVEAVCQDTASFDLSSGALHAWRPPGSLQTTVLMCLSHHPLGTHEPLPG